MALLLLLQEAFARSRVRRVDEQERSLATGKRKTSIARVWLRPGAGHIMVNQKVGWELCDSSSNLVTVYLNLQ